MNDLKAQLFSFIEHPDFPCIGAKAAAKKKCLDVIVCEDLNSSKDDTKILARLYGFIDQWQKNKDHLQTVAFIFKKPISVSEKKFELLLWSRLQSIHNLDSQIYKWDPNVSASVSDPHFSFSIGHMSFFIVGLHSNSSRRARKFTYPTLVFNLHEQFEKIREEGIFERMRNKIREADIAFSGSINPMVQDFGKSTEAIQYSGREVNKKYRCPFHKNTISKRNWITIKPCSGTGFILKKNDLLVVEDTLGEQVSDLFCASLNDSTEFLSSGKSIDYNSSLFFMTNSRLYSNKSNVMLSIIRDEVGKHDFLFAPCSKETFQIIYGKKSPSFGCYEHLSKALLPYGVKPENITTTFNIFMNVGFDRFDEKLKVLPPLSRKGDKIIFKSHMDLIIGLTACSAPQSNNFSFKPINYKIIANA